LTNCQAVTALAGAPLGAAGHDDPVALPSDPPESDGPEWVAEPESKPVCKLPSPEPGGLPSAASFADSPRDPPSATLESMAPPSSVSEELKSSLAFPRFAEQPSKRQAARTPGDLQRLVVVRALIAISSDRHPAASGAPAGPGPIR
jgi:hypothetical protein